MSEALRALLIQPQEARLRSRFGLGSVPLHLITSGWHRLVVVALDRVFVFPRHEVEVPMLEREAGVLAALHIDFAPRLLGLHRDQSISPYPFLELTRIPGRSYDVIEASLPFGDIATCLAGLGRRIAQWHHVAMPAEFNARPEHLDPPRLSDAWTQPEAVRGTAHFAVESLRPHLGALPVELWAEALLPIAELERTTVHGEVSDGQFLVDDRLRVTGVVDWNGLHRNHPLVDLDFGVGGYRICRWPQRWGELRHRIWEGYVSERGVPLPEWRSVNLLWCLLDAMTLLPSERADSRWNKTLADLSEATGAFQ